MAYSRQYQSRDELFQKISSLCALHGAVPDFTSYINAKTPFNYLCRCGAVSSIRSTNLISKGYKSLCSICSKVELSITPKQLVETAKQSFLSKCSLYGSTPDLSTYQNARSRISITCSCGNVFEKMWCNLSHENEHATCVSCTRKHFVAENHPSWNPELTDEDRAGRTGDLRNLEWIRQVLRAGNYRCAITGERTRDLAAHHIYNYGHYPELRYEVSNGVLLRRDLHIEFHNKYGYGHNTKEQFMEFFQDKTSLNLRAS